MVNISGSGNDEVGSNIVSSMVILDILAGDVGKVFSDSLDWLSHEVISVGSIMDSLESGLLLILDAKRRSKEWISFSFELVLIIGGVEEEVSEQIDGLSKFAWLESESIGGSFSGWGDRNISSQEI